MTDGYYRHPTVHGDRVVFACEDDLWEVPLAGGIARRLTSGRAVATRPIFSPDGASIAFTSSDQLHPEAWVMPSDGGEPERLSYTGAIAGARAWSPDGEVIVASNHEQAFWSLTELYEVDAAGGPLRRMGLGPASDIAWSKRGAVAIGRHTADPARWKRYRGGRVGQIWVDRTGDGTWRRILKDLDGNLASPMWIGARLWFISDHEGIGNLYSSTAAGGDVRRHTSHDEFYVRYPSTDGKTIVYHAGARLFRIDPKGGEAEEIEVELHSPRTQRQRRIVPARANLQGYSIHPDGHSVAVEVRGQVHSMPLWERAPRRWDSGEAVRSRHGHWLAGGERFITISDAGGEEGIDVFSAADATHPDKRLALDLGRPIHVVPSPTDQRLAITNHRHELLLVDVNAGKVHRLDHSEHERIGRPSWSPDGRWIAYAWSATPATSAIRLADVEKKKTHDVTRAEFRDFCPTFDAKGRHLYFISYRDYAPIYDSHVFDLAFPRGARPMLVTLAADTPSPFDREPKAPGGGEPTPTPKADDKAKPKPAAKAAAKKTTATKKAATRSAAKPAAKASPKAAASGPAKPDPIKVDLDGIHDRVLAFPVPEGRYEQVGATKDKVLFIVRDAVARSSWDSSEEPGGRLQEFDFDTRKVEHIAGGVDSFRLSRDGGTVAYRSGSSIRVFATGAKPEDGGYTRAAGWVDLSRIRVSIDPPLEWRQMLLESWRLQRDHFWVADMSGIAWEHVRDRYLPLVDRIASRAEFSDLVWELQGELGTSHAYEYGGERRESWDYAIGRLGVDLERAPKTNRWRIARILRGDSWEPRVGSPLAAPGLDVKEGSTLLAIAGHAVTADRSPHELLVGQAGTEVELVVGDAKGAKPRRIAVRTLWSEDGLRYREWVERNRAAVHERTGGRVGYVHIPDMGPRGFGEFHRSWPAEAQRLGGLVVDVRCNGGGHVSQLLLEKLARRALGIELSRWGQPETYPAHAVLGPMVAITNEVAGSDGDIFSHAWKMLGLGPLLGTRTWGGVIGINPSHPLADGSLTTQPEYAFWFNDAGYKVENYGTDPDIEVEIAPHDYLAGRDTQLDAALKLMEQLRKQQPGDLPDLGERPRLGAGPTPAPAPRKPKSSTPRRRARR